MNFHLLLWGSYVLFFSPWYKATDDWLDVWNLFLNLVRWLPDFFFLGGEEESCMLPAPAAFEGWGELVMLSIACVMWKA